MTADKKKKGFWATAFAIEKVEDFTATEDEMKILDSIAKKVVKRGLATPGILFLESSRPMNFIGAQAMAFFEPIVRSIFSEWDAYTTFYKIMERRGSIECLTDRVELFEDERQEEIKKAKAERKAKKLKARAERDKS